MIQFFLPLRINSGGTQNIKFFFWYDVQEVEAAEYWQTQRLYPSVSPKVLSFMFSETTGGFFLLAVYCSITECTLRFALKGIAGVGFFL